MVSRQMNEQQNRKDCHAKIRSQSVIKGQCQSHQLNNARELARFIPSLTNCITLR
uniref:Uncharacterized protein n=1 Tax=Rhizophora mucronata TaxID=61149 RepID=A0A2P2ILG5_RHIMU